MPIQWYPGHMTKTRKAIAESMPSQDVVIEVLDARMPRASENPVLGELRGNKPCIKALSKSDLADPEITRAWLAHFEERARDEQSGTAGRRRVVGIALRSDRPGETTRRIPELCRELAGNPRGPGRSVRAMIVGIPNVGKSTLINTLMQRKVAKVGDEPAVTKAAQQVVLKNGMTLFDQPGILWPKIDDSASTLRLALGGAMPDTAIEYVAVALFGAAFLMERYPDRLRVRYKLAHLPSTPNDLIAEIGRRRGSLRAGGVVDLHKASDVLIHDFRTGALGAITLESPGDASSPHPADSP